MTGRVTNDLEATIAVQVDSPRGVLRPFVGVIDTGFNGHLTAPPEVVATLGLIVCGDTETELGDGRVVFLPTYEAEVEWFGARRVVPLLASEGGILVGMSLMRGCRLTVDVEPDGGLEIAQRAK